MANTGNRKAEARKTPPARFSGESRGGRGGSANLARGGDVLVQDDVVYGHPAGEKVREPELPAPAAHRPAVPRAQRALRKNQGNSQLRSHQIEAAIEGASREGGGVVPALAPTRQGEHEVITGRGPAGGTTAGPGQNPDDPSVETGGPRGAGYPVSATSGGYRQDGSYIRDPREEIRRSTSWKRRLKQ